MADAEPTRPGEPGADSTPTDDAAPATGETPANDSAPVEPAGNASPTRDAAHASAPLGDTTTDARPSDPAATGETEASDSAFDEPAGDTPPSNDAETTTPTPEAAPTSAPLDDTAENAPPPDNAETTTPTDDAPAKETPEATNSIGGTIPPWWTWVGSHRKPVVLVVVLVVVAVVGTVVAVSLTRERPQDVVRAYLDALRSGDTQAALEIAGEPEDNRRVRFLSADALADDWAVDAIAERHVRDTEADVDVTISAGGTSKQGRFHMVKDDDGWKMESPFVKVDLAVPGLDVVELGGVRQPAERDQATQLVPLLLFPGVYELYPSLGDRLTFDPALFIAAPREADESVIRLAPAYSLTEAGATAAQKAVNTAIDECATQAVRNPPGCPFDITEASALWVYDDVTDVGWTVVTHPEAHFATRNDGGIALVVRKPGTVRVTGTGIPGDGAAPAPFALTCEFGLDNLTVAVQGDDIVIEHVTGDEYAAAFSTTCF